MKNETTTTEGETVSEEELQRNAQDALKEIEITLSKYNCRLTASIIVTEGGNFPKVQITNNLQNLNGSAKNK
jgi:hypothetical protein